MLSLIKLILIVLKMNKILKIHQELFSLLICKRLNTEI